MPVHRHKKDTTPTVPGSTPEQPTPVLPDQQTFQQFLRDHAVHFIVVDDQDMGADQIGIGVGRPAPGR